MVRTVLVIFIICALAVLTGFLSKGKIELPSFSGIKFEITTKTEVPEKKVEEKKPEPVKKEDKTAEVYFVEEGKGNKIAKPHVVSKKIGTSKKSFEVAIRTLIDGPSSIDRLRGAYTAIPEKTKVIEIREDANSWTINLSEEFEYGGGTASMQTRVNQLIKTAIEAADGKDVYLEIEGKRVEALGGEGIHIPQPLRKE